MHGGKYFSICSSFQFTHLRTKEKTCQWKNVLCYNKTNKNQQTEHGVAVNEYEFIIRKHSIFFHVFRVYNPISCAIMFVCVCVRICILCVAPVCYESVLSVRKPTGVSLVGRAPCARSHWLAQCIRLAHANGRNPVASIRTRGKV